MHGSCNGSASFAMESHILQEIAHVAKFLGGTSNSSDLLSKLALSMCKQIQSLSYFDTAMAANIKDALVSSKYTEDGKASIIKVIEEKLVGKLDVVVDKACHRNGWQKLYEQLPYFLTCHSTQKQK